VGDFRSEVWRGGLSTGGVRTPDDLVEHAIDAILRCLLDQSAEIDSDYPYVMTVCRHEFRFDNLIFTYYYILY